MEIEKISGYARLLAQARIRQKSKRSFLGKPYLKYGQCIALWSYFFQLGSILGAKHASNLDAFGTAFLGLHGEHGAIKSFFLEHATNLKDSGHWEKNTFLEYVCTDQLARLDYTGDPMRFLSERAMIKIKADNVILATYQYSEQGAALGAIHPHIMRQMFERTHSLHSKDNWEKAHKAGLDISPVEEITGYEEVEADENSLFMEYCKECCPNLHAILIESV